MSVTSGDQRRTDKEIPQWQIDERCTVEDAVGKGIPAQEYAFCQWITDWDWYMAEMAFSL